MMKYLVCIVLVVSTFVRAADVFSLATDAQIKITQGTAPTGEAKGVLSETWRIRRIVLDGGGEAYVTSLPRTGKTPDEQAAETPTPALAIRAGNAGKLTGKIYFNGDYGRKVSRFINIEITADSSPGAQRQFYLAKADYYDTQIGMNRPGNAWFRHQAAAARKLADPEGNKNIETPGVVGGMPLRPANRDFDDEMFDLFTGSRAVSENLQLDRGLLQRASTTQPSEVALDSVKGISVAPMDFNARLGNANPALDNLAGAIPADQHAVFIPSIQAVTLLEEKWDQSSIPVLQSLVPDAPKDDSVLDRYKKQLCLDSGALAKLIGPSVVKSIAITGSDPYFSAGTDVAVIFEAENPAALRGLLAAQQTLRASLVPGAMQVQGKISGAQYAGWFSAGRAVCSYIAIVGNNVVVTNSRAQLQQLAAVDSGAIPSLAKAPEFRFFRNRYVMGTGDECALVILSDATIRRWCSPAWRIADNRRTIAMSAMLELQAQNADLLVTGKGQSNLNLDGFHAGDISIAPGGMLVSSVYGSSQFLTPISEIKLTHATKSEVESYERWRDTYQRYWRGYFDPIALRISAKENRIGADITVMPLIAGNDYEQMLSITRGAHLNAKSADPHDALFHIALAINKESPTFKSWGTMGQSILGLKIDPLAWVGSSIGIFVDDDPIIADLIALGQENPWDTTLMQVPLGLWIESTDPLRLAGFLTAMRAMADQGAPGLLQWETLTHNEKSYVKVSSKQILRPGQEFSVYYAAMPDCLAISLNEGVIQRAMDRRANAGTTRPATRPATQPSSRWLGDNAGLQIRDRGIEAINQLIEGESMTRDMQASWQNIPILNEWHRLFPEMDPVEVHRKIFGERVLCPFGGKYVWNEQLQTMESTKTRCPEKPATKFDRRPNLVPFSLANFGITLEPAGLRARVELDILSTEEQQKRRESSLKPHVLSPAIAQKACLRRIQNLWAFLDGMDASSGKVNPETDKGLAQVLLSNPISPRLLLCPGSTKEVPADWEAMTVDEMGKWIHDNASYHFRRPAGELTPDKPQVLLYESPGQHADGSHVVYSDGRVEMVPDAKLKELIGK